MKSLFKYIQIQRKFKKNACQGSQYNTMKHLQPEMLNGQQCSRTIAVLIMTIDYTLTHYHHLTSHDIADSKAEQLGKLIHCSSEMHNLTFQI